MARGGHKFLIITKPNGHLQVVDIWQSTEELLQIARQCCVVSELTPDEQDLFGVSEG